MDATEIASQLTTLWSSYLNVTGATQSTEYQVCYPPALIGFLAKRTVEGCKALGIRPFGQTIDNVTVDIQQTLGTAWNRFLDDPMSYAEWEQAQLREVWRIVGVD